MISSSLLVRKLGGGVLEAMLFSVLTMNVIHEENDFKHCQIKGCTLTGMIDKTSSSTGESVTSLHFPHPNITQIIMKTTRSMRMLIPSLACGICSIGSASAANLALYEFNGGSGASTSSSGTVTTTNFTAVGADPGLGISSFSEAPFIRGRVTPDTLAAALVASPIRYFETSITATAPSVNLGSVIFTHLATNDTAEDWTSRFAVYASLDDFSTSSLIGTSSVAVPASSGTNLYDDFVHFSLAPVGASMSSGDTLTIRVFAYDPTIDTVDEGNLISRFDDFRIEDEFVVVIPEPSSVLLGFMALGGMAFRRRRSV